MTSTSSRLAFLVLAHLKVMVGGSIEFGNGFPADATGQPLSCAGPWPPAGSVTTGSSG